MYSSGYSQVSRGSPASQKKLQYRSKGKGKSCGYYMRIVFFFSSLIQSLIIVSLVLFLVYGKTQDSPSTSRIQDLEESFSRLSIENVVLKGQRKNLTSLLNTTLIEKARNDWDLAEHRYYANISSILIQEMEKKQVSNLLSFFSLSNMYIPVVLLFVFKWLYLKTTILYGIKLLAIEIKVVIYVCGFNAMLESSWAY